VAASSFTLGVTAKLVNVGTNSANYPNNPSSYDSLYSTSTVTGVHFVSAGIPNAFTAIEDPVLFHDYSNVSGWSTYTIGTGFNMFNVSNGYTLNVTFPTLLNQPIFYVNFQKGGPTPNAAFCSDTTVYAWYRLYTTYRRIMIVQFLSSTLPYA
jgi:hypothetical protein